MVAFEETQMNGENNSKRRSKPQIYFDILDVTPPAQEVEPKMKILFPEKEQVRFAKKTHIMYRANLSFKQINDYLKELLDQGLIVTFDGNGDGKGYQRTEKGTRAHSDLRRLKEYHLVDIGNGNSGYRGFN